MYVLWRALADNLSALPPHVEPHACTAIKQHRAFSIVGASARNRGALDSLGALVAVWPRYCAI